MGKWQRIAAPLSIFMSHGSEVPFAVLGISMYPPEFQVNIKDSR
jgi:hypothetical protein